MIVITLNEMQAILLVATIFWAIISPTIFFLMGMKHEKKRGKKK